jgi:hypothetical protein
MTQGLVYEEEASTVGVDTRSRNGIEEDTEDKKFCWRRMSGQTASRDGEGLMYRYCSEDGGWNEMAFFQAG